MKTYAASALSALCLVGVAACGSSDTASDSGASSPPASEDTRLGTMSALSGRSDVDLFASWSPGVGYQPNTVGSEKVNPQAVTVTCTGSGDSLAVSAKFPNGDFTTRRDTAEATFQFPGLPQISTPLEGTVLWEGNGIGAEYLTIRAQADIPRLDELQAAPSIYARFAIACPLPA